MPEDDEDMGEKLIASADFDGPTGDRACTDVLCSLLLITSWVIMSVLGAYSVSNGDWRVVIYPLDYDGNICGTDFRNDMTDYPYLWYINSYGGGVCVDRCPSLTNQVSDNLTDIRSMITYGGYWQADGAELSGDFVQVGNYSFSDDALFCSDEDCFPNNSPAQSWTSQGVNEGYGYSYYVVDSYPLLQRCFFTSGAIERAETLVNASSTITFVDDAYTFWNELYADIWTAKAYILGFGFGVAVAISFAFTVILRIPAFLNSIVWGSIFLSIAFFFVSGYYTFQLADTWDSEEPQTQSDRTITATRISAYVLWGIGVIMFLLMCCLRKQIQLAIGCVKETSRAFQRMPSIIFVPLIQATGFVIFLVVLTIYAVYLASLGEITVQEIPVGINGPDIAVRSYEFDDFIEQSAWYLLFCLFWTASFIVAVGDMIVAMSFAKWYFTKDKTTVGTGTVLGSIYDTMWYHLGTCAFGSLVLAIVQLIRAILTRIQKQVKKANSKIADCLLCCCQCCLWCFEKCVRFLSKHAYIHTAIFGTAFCASARQAFFLILRNAGRISAISYVSSALMIVGKLFISVITTTLSYFVIVEVMEENLYSYAGPVIFVFIISYFVADMFMDIYEVGINTILQCFIADEEMFDGDECYAENELQTWIDKYEDD